VHRHATEQDQLVDADDCVGAWWLFEDCTWLFEDCTWLFEDCTWLFEDCTERRAARSSSFAGAGQERAGAHHNQLAGCCIFTTGSLGGAPVGVSLVGRTAGGCL